LIRDLLGHSAACTSIPYGINHVWQMGASLDGTDARPASHATPDCAQSIREALLDLAGARRRPRSGFLVEKTCANTLRVPFVQRVLPDAHFVHIVRDGRDAATSARAQWQSPPTLAYLLGKLRYVPLRNAAFVTWYARNLWQGWRDGSKRVRSWGPRYPGMDADLESESLLHVCARQWNACVTRCLDALQTLPDDRVTHVRYEDLVSDPAAFDRVLSRLALPDAEALRRNYHAVVHARSVRRWQRDLTPQEQRALTALLSPTLDRVAATLPLTHAPS
jgi:hypothetical protein